MAEPHWRKVDDTVLGLECDFHPRCFNCQSKMEDINCRFLNFAPDMTKPDDYDAHAIDVNVICQSCGWQTTFGVAVEEEHFREAIEVSEGIRQKLAEKYEALITEKENAKIIEEVMSDVNKEKK